MSNPFSHYWSHRKYPSSTCSACQRNDSTNILDFFCQPSVMDEFRFIMLKAKLDEIIKRKTRKERIDKLSIELIK